MTDESQIESGIRNIFKKEWVIISVVLAAVGVFFGFVIVPIQQIRLEVAIMQEQLKQITSYEPRITKLEDGQQDQNDRITRLETKVK